MAVTKIAKNVTFCLGIKKATTILLVVAFYVELENGLRILEIL